MSGEAQTSAGIDGDHRPPPAFAGGKTHYGRFSAIRGIDR